MAENEDSDEPMVDVAKTPKETEARKARIARKRKVLEEANERLKTGQALVGAAGNSMNVVVPEKSSVKPRSPRYLPLFPPTSLSPKSLV